jgi:hypothetical protein
MNYVGEKALDPLTIEIYTPAAENHFMIQEEDQSPIGVLYSRQGSSLTVTVDPSPGQVNLIVYGVSIRSASARDQKLELEALENGFQVSFNNPAGRTVLLDLE